MFSAVGASLLPESATREQVTGIIKQWRALREERLAADKVAAKIKEKEIAAKEFLVAAMLSQEYEGILCDARITGVSRKPVPAVEDRQIFEEYIIDNRALHLLQFRISPAAIQEMIDDGVEVPGIGSIETFDLFDRKA